ncbi:MAG: hypothetical protein ABH857_05610 [Elusimicrobiota bacterium]
MKFLGISFRGMGKRWLSGCVIAAILTHFSIGVVYATYIPKPKIDQIIEGDTTVETIDEGDGYIELREDNSTVIRITGENVGIGTTVPTEKLHVTGDILSDTTIQAGIGDFDTIYVSSISGNSPLHVLTNLVMNGHDILSLNNLSVLYGVSAATGVFSGAVAAATLDTGHGANELYAMNQDVESTDAVTFTTLDTVHGANELYAMNQDVESTDAVTFTTLDTGQGANELYAMNQDVQTTDEVTFATATVTYALAAATLNTGQGAYELYAMNQDVESTDAVTFTTIDTGQGANELYDMNQNVQTTDEVTFATATVTYALAAATLNTGQGANELYDMNQNVQTTDTVTFAEVKTSTVSAQGAGGLYLVDDGNNGMFVEDGGQVGIGTLSPNSSLHVNGSLTLSLVNKTNDYTATANDYMIAANGSGNTVTIALPTASGITGRVYEIVATNVDNQVDIDPNGAETISGMATYTFSDPYESVTIVSDGTNWVIK